MGIPIRFFAPSTLVAGVAIAGFSGPAFGQQLTEANGSSTYVVQFKAKPGAAYTGDLPGFAATAPAPGSSYDKNLTHVQRYTDHLIATHNQALAAVGASDAKIYDYCHAMNGVAARLTAGQAAALRKRDDVANVWRDYSVEVETNNSPEFLGLLNTRTGLRQRYRLKGEDIIVGVLDTGAIQEHPSFADSEPRPLPKFCSYPKNERQERRCERLRARPPRQVYGPPPARWNGICQAGEAWTEDDCNNKMIGARWFVDGFLAGRGSVVEGEFLSPRDSSGHGSHTAGTAAGNDVIASLAGTPLAPISGMAPRARLSIYKVCWLSPGATNFSCFFSDTAAATDAAVADGVDVINFSVGTAAAFNDPQDLAFLDATTAGVFVARSAGNDGPGFATTNAGEPWVTSVAASTLSGKGFALAATVNSPESVAGDYTALEGAITQPLTESGPVNGDVTAAEPIDACTPLTNSIGGNVALIARGACAFTVKVENAVAAGATAILMYSDDRPKTVMGGTSTATTSSVPGVMIDNAPGLALGAALAAGETVNISLSAGNFVTEDLEGDIMADFSSRGPFSTEADWIKPDITAPGVRILAPSTPEPADGSAGDLFAYLQGTSMSSPHIAGLAALVKEAHPNWSPAQIKSALMTTARQDVVKEDGTTPGDPFDFGAGHVSPNDAINPGLTYNASQLDYLAASCGTVSPLVTASDCAFIADTLGLSTDPADLNLPSIGVSELPGTKTIRRTVTAVSDFRRRGSRRPSRYRAIVFPPEGFDVTVSPAELRMRPGDTATFEVTITNVSAPAGEWRFGTLLWEDNRGHKVRSPIAVNAQAVVAPAQVDGTGADGTADFDVTFGYDGPYTAQVHGLNPASLSLSTIPDDPSDNFVFLGPGVEIAFLGEIPAGTAFARWSTFNEYTSGNDDIDLYLYYCPEFSCTQIASSSNGDSNETVDVLLPQNDPAIEDPYLILAHGFETEGPSADVLLFNWQFGLVDDAGNMTVNAPTVATTGSTSNLSINWSGLPVGPAAKQLGAISHSDASGIQALTIINITNDAGLGLCDVPGACP
ncbi:MAG: S8 family serine peptidase [Myxococcota bacterium]